MGGAAPLLPTPTPSVLGTQQHRHLNAGRTCRSVPRRNEASRSAFTGTAVLEGGDHETRPSNLLAGFHSLLITQQMWDPRVDPNSRRRGPAPGPPDFTEEAGQGRPEDKARGISSLCFCTPSRSRERSQNFENELLAKRNSP